MTEGDWLSLSEVGLGRADGTEDRLVLRSNWDQPATHIVYDASNRKQPFPGPTMEDRHWLWETAIVPWQQAQKQGIGVMVGEFGCHHKTPHDVALAWMEDCLANWQRADWGWALWNFRGSFGILDSQREDVQYEQFEGHQVDRKMLDLLRRY